MTKLLAEDADAPGSHNSHVVYHLLSSEAEEGVEEPVFELDSTSGTVILGSVPLQAGQNFLLRVVAADLGGAEGGKCPDGGHLGAWPAGTLTSAMCHFLRRPQQYL